MILDTIILPSDTSEVSQNNHYKPNNQFFNVRITNTLSDNTSTTSRLAQLFQHSNPTAGLATSF